MTEQIHRAKINKSNDRTNTQSLVYLRSVYLFCHLTCLSSLCVFGLSFDLFIFALCIWSVIQLVLLRSVYLFCHQNEDKQVKWLTKYTERRKTSQMTEQTHRAKINKSNDRTNMQNLFIFALCICSVIWLVYLRSCICSVIWFVYLRSVYLFCNSTCLSSFCVFVL
jgi:Flp pilus assembly protein TadB